MTTAHALPELESCAPAGARRFDPFRPLGREQARRLLTACLRELEHRDGPLDFEAQLLPHRERRLRELLASRVAWRGRLGDAGARGIWLAGLSKANESESWGAEGEYRRLRARGTRNVDPGELYVLIEEQYHRRLLAEAWHTCGFEPGDPLPPAPIRLLIRVMQHLPGWIRYAPILCGEVLGCVVFQELLDRCQLFSEQPEVEARLRTLIEEVLDDERLHVLYSRARLGAWGVRLARGLLPLVALVFTRSIPQLLELGCERSHLIEQIRTGLPLPRAFSRAQQRSSPAS
jgi:hypothetical protein